MELDLEGKHADRAYALLSALVTPRPIAWVTTVDMEGLINVAPFSFFNVLGVHPPVVGFCPADRADGTPTLTVRNIASTHEFVVNLVDESVAEAMLQTTASLPPGICKLERAGLTTGLSTAVRPPRIAESPASLECTEYQTLQIGANRLVIGLVKRIHVREELLDSVNWRIRTERFLAVGRLGGSNWYCRTQDRFELPPSNVVGG